MSDTNIMGTRAFHPSELPDHLKEAVKEARMDDRHDPLNELLKPSVMPVFCYCALTGEGTLIPWLCDTDRERLLSKIAEMRKPWTACSVNIVPDEDS